MTHPEKLTSTAVQNRWLVKVSRRTVFVSTASFVGVAVILMVLQAQAVFLNVAGFSLSVYLLVLSVGLLCVALVAGLPALKRSSYEMEEVEGTLRFGLLVLSPLLLVSLYAAIRLAMDWRLEGAQNLLALLVLSLGPLVFGFLQHRISEDSILRLYSGLTAFVAIVYMVFNFFSLTGFADRQFAMVALIGLAAAASVESKNWVYRVSPYVIFVAIVVSGSRTAAAIALVLLLFVVLRSSATSLRRRMIGIAGIFAGGLGLGFAIYWGLDLVGVRQTEAGSSGAVSEILTNTNGRWGAWVEFLGLLNSPSDWLLGIGTGGAMQFGTANLAFFSHPHNEYIRFLVDLGILGLLLLLIGCLLVVWALLRQGGLATASAKAAFLVILALAGMSITDGPLYSSFVVVPASLLIGLGLRSRWMQRSKSPHVPLPLEERGEGDKRGA